ncbi:transcriptional regulator [Streptomyces sp. NBC_01411]|uniref:transcriptional regulator n=1 Tax=Streptomyces sp. NBC_01411 TaxID=2903857 RepID=UPI003251DB66
MRDIAVLFDYLVLHHGGTAASLLRRIAERHKSLGYGGLECHRQKLDRWKKGTAPDRYTQLALADLLSISAHDVIRLGWPAWLERAVPDVLLFAHHASTSLHEAPERAGDPVQRRRFLLLSAAGGMSAALAMPAPAESATAGQRVGASLASLHEQRLDALRHLDDRIGSGHVYSGAVGEYNMIKDTLRTASYTEPIEDRLVAVAADAQRAAGWTAYDSGDPETAEEHFATAAELALKSANPEVMANTCAFWAIKCYSTNEPGAAASLVETAQAYGRATGSARMIAMLHARACRAYARAHDPRASDRAANAALSAYEKATPLHEDLSCLYWVNQGEIHQLLGSSALNLGRPSLALHHFEQAAVSNRSETYDGDSFPRGAAIYEARAAEAYLALNDLDGAVRTAHQAVDHMGGVRSARGSTALADLRSKFRAHGQVPVIKEFLEMTR